MSTKTKLYIAHGVRCDKLMPAPDSTVDEAAWMDFGEFLTDSPDREELCAPFRPPLRQWIGRHHHLRGDKDVKFGRALLYNKHRWIGARPGDYLSSLLNGLSVRNPHSVLLTFDRLRSHQRNTVCFQQSTISAKANPFPKLNVPFTLVLVCCLMWSTRSHLISATPQKRMLKRWQH